MLNYRQNRAYTDIVNLHAPTLGTIDPETHELSETVYSALPTASSVRCHWEPKPEASLPAAPGRTNQDIIITTDIFHFHSSVEIGDQWFIQLLTPGHPEYGNWFCVIGAPKTVNWRAKKISVLAKKSLRPYRSPLVEEEEE